MSKDLRKNTDPPCIVSVFAQFRSGGKWLYAANYNVAGTSHLTAYGDTRNDAVRNAVRAHEQVVASIATARLTR